jgi:hypothetical protein
MIKYYFLSLLLGILHLTYIFWQIYKKSFEKLEMIADLFYSRFMVDAYMK